MHKGVDHKENMQNYKGNTHMSEEEQRIRGELEMDIEKNLEGEIKDELSRLALRLHRLYQHQKDKQTCSKPQQQKQEQLKQQQLNKSNKNKAVFEVNIRIKVEGGTIIEIKEIKKKPAEKYNNNKFHVSKHDSTKNVTDHKKFDWANSLRSIRPLKTCHNVVRKKIQMGKEVTKNPKGKNLLPKCKLRTA